MNAQAQNIASDTKKRFKTAFDFVQSLERVLPVYVESADKIYVNYQVRKTSSVEIEDEIQNLVLMPDAQAMPHVICDIPNSAVVATNIRIIPGESIGKVGPYLSGTPKGKKSPTAMPLLLGLAAMQNGYYEGGAMLPVVTYKDLRESPSRNMSYARVHSVKTDSLEEYSDKMKDNINELLNNKIDSVLRFFKKKFTSTTKTVSKKVAPSSFNTINES